MDATSTSTNITGNSIGETLKRAAMVFAFWAFVTMVLGYVYNEVLMSEHAGRYTHGAGAKSRALKTELVYDENGEPTEVPVLDEDDDLASLSAASSVDKYLIDYHQLVSASIAVGVMAVLGRCALEAVAHYGTPQTAGILSGQAVSVVRAPAATVSSDSATAYGQDEAAVQQQESQPSLQQDYRVPPAQMTVETQQAPPPAPPQQYQHRYPPPAPLPDTRRY